MFFGKRNSCTTCAQLKSIRLKTPEDFLNCLQTFKGLMESGAFEHVSSDFEIDHPKNERGFWKDDILEYTILCKTCGRQYCCFCDTYHGRADLCTVK